MSCPGNSVKVTDGVLLNTTQHDVVGPTWASERLFGESQATD